MAPVVPRTKFNNAGNNAFKSAFNSAFNSSALIRLLTERGIVAAAAIPANFDRTERTDRAVKPQSFAEKLGLWLDWTDAIALSAALQAGVVLQRPTAPQASSAAALPACTAKAALGQARSDLSHSITASIAASIGEPETADAGFTMATPTPRWAAPAPVVPAGGAADFSPYRHSHRALQQTMETRISQLRAQVRAALSGLSPDLQRLAALDAVLDKAFEARERHLLATLPPLLEAHFKRLGTAHAATSSAGPAPGWLAVFCNDMQDALRAELDFRLQAVDGLIDAIPIPATRLS